MKRLSTKGFDLVNGVRGLLFPPTCLFLPEPLETVAGNSCCSTCFEKIAIWPRLVCHCCGAELPEVMAPGLCGHCLNRPPSHSQAETRSIYAYRGPVRDAILNWKLQA